MLTKRKSVFHRLFVQNRLGMIGLLLFAVFVVVAIVGPFIVKGIRTRCKYCTVFVSPWMDGRGSADHPFGTDSGRTGRVGSPR